MDCDDGDFCTADSCDDVTGCANEPIQGCPYTEVPTTSPWARVLLLVLLGVMATSLLVVRRGDG